MSPCREEFRSSYGGRDVLWLKEGYRRKYYLWRRGKSEEGDPNGATRGREVGPRREVTRGGMTCRRAGGHRTKLWPASKGRLQEGDLLERGRS
jgi:hypothetical protein